MSLRKITLSLFCTTAAAMAVGSGLDRRQYPTKPCAQATGGIHLIVVPGEGYTNPPFGLLDSTAAGILQAIPGSTNVSLPYNHSDTNGIQQTDAGAATLRTYIEEYQDACPYTRMAIISYSAGGIIMMNVLCGEIDPPWPSNIPPLSISTYSGNLLAAISYGEETRTASANYNLGTCTVNSPHPRSPANQGNCELWSQILQSYCDSGDPNCCSTGTDINDHYVYAYEYNQDVINFVVAQFQKWGN